jgi:DNA-binding transcriptional ArsR family regulator
MVNNPEGALDAVFAALSDPTRRTILQRLARGEATVSELAEPFDMSLPAVSKHLRVLESAGLLSREVEGRVHRIELAAGPLREAMRWLEDYRRFWSARLDALAAYVENLSPKEAATWQRPASPRTPRSASSGHSRRGRSRSSRRGRRPKR